MNVIFQRQTFGLFQNVRAIFCTKMNSNTSIEELQSLTKEQLIKKILYYKSSYNQVINQKKKENNSKLRKMISKVQFGRRKKSKVIDFKESNYRRVALKIAYLGWDYDGLQANPNMEDTIEEIVREAFRQTRLAAEDDPLRISRCGRTDKGVSAFQQVITVRLRSRLTSGPGVTKWVDPSTLTVDDREPMSIDKEDRHDKALELDDSTIIPANDVDKQPSSKTMLSETAENKIVMMETSDTDENVCKVVDDDISAHKITEEFDYVLILNRILPPEIRILAWTPIVDDNFSARHDCIGREYRYYFPRGKLNIAAMDVAAKQFCGLHDFRNFSKVQVVNTTVFVRRIDEFVVKEIGNSTSAEDPYDMCYAKIIGSGFVYHQVRYMMAVLYLIGGGFEKPDVIPQLLDVETNIRKPSYDLVVGNPLTLYKTQFHNLSWRVSRRASIFLTQHLQAYWSSLATKACLTKELIHVLEDDESIVIEEDESLPNEGNSSCHGVHISCELNPFTKRHMKAKPYKDIMSKPRGNSVNEKIANLERKRKRHGETDSALKIAK